MADVVFENVTKRFGRVTAVENLTLEIEDGEFIVLLGPTGAGKTTTLRLAGGLEVPDHGRILIGGNDVTKTPSAVRDVAFVFQQYSLYPHYTVFDNMAFPLRAPLRRTSAAAIKERVTQIACLLRIEDKLDNRATQLSGGEMQRVAIGRALVREPAAFLMDEPLSSLDAKLREDLRVELKRIQVDLGATILYVRPSGPGRHAAPGLRRAGDRLRCAQAGFAPDQSAAHGRHGYHRGTRWGRDHRHPARGRGAGPWRQGGRQRG